MFMAKDTTRDRIWDAALVYRSEWEEKEFKERRTKYGWTAEELMEMQDLEASKKTVLDTLLTLEEYGWLEGVGGKGGQPREFSVPP